MSTMQRLTLIGMYNFDNTLFDSLTLPDGYDKPTFIDSLLLEHGEKCVLYTDVDFMKYSIGAVSRKWANELTRIYDALTAEYDPLSNYDRTEEIKDSRGKKFNEKTEGDYTDARTDNLQSKRTAGLTNTDTQTIAGTTEREVSAYDSSSYAPSEKNTYNNGTSTRSETGTDTIDNTGTLNTRHAGTFADKNGGETENYSRSVHMYGNIGITTNVQMWTEEVRARFNNNLYGITADIFANELLIQIY